MSKGSISLLRANPLLTTNCMLMVDTNYNLYLASYSANRELSDKKFKKFTINKDSFLSQRIATFYNGLPTDIAFDVKNDIKSDSIQNNYINQFDDIYYSGARKVEDTSYVEEFQYNTTLKIDPLNLPTNFFIFRNDGPGLELDNTTIFDNLKIVSTFDLTEKSTIGKLWKKNYIDDDVLPRSPIELNFKQFEFSKWSGYDYYTGGSIEKSFFIDEYIQNQTTDFEFETFLTEGFKKNGVVCSNYSNISYLFDDTVSSIFIKDVAYSSIKYPIISSLIKSKELTLNVDVTYDNGSKNYTFINHFPYRKKWTINRYSGFYVNSVDYITKVSTHLMPKFSNDNSIVITDNKFSDYPLVNEWNENVPAYIPIGTDRYLIEKQSNEYVIISDKKINGNMLDLIGLAIKPIKIEFEKPLLVDTYNSYIKYTDGSYFYDSKFDQYTNGILVIKLIDKYYRLKLDTTNKRTYILADELILADANTLSSKLGNNNTVYNNLQVITKDNTITYFEISFLNFTEISDFDYNHIDTKLTKIEYDTNDGINQIRPYIAELNIQDISKPIGLYYERGYSISKNSSILIPATNNFVLPVASEYAASSDLYLIDEQSNLTKIWDLNQSITKWTIADSINTNAYGYKINNSLDIHGVYNFTPNMYQQNKSINDLNLDWFYSIGKPLNYNFENFNDLTNFTTFRNPNIINNSINIDLARINVSTNNDAINLFQKFDIEYYKNVNAQFDYFDYIFNIPFKIDDDNINLYENVDRLSYVQVNDSINGPEVFFKGIHANLLYVDLDNPNILENTYKTRAADDLVGYGFSVLFSPRYTNDSNLYGKSGIEIILNKIHKNILINVYLNVPYSAYSITSIDYRKRDLLYTEDKVKYVSNSTWVDSELSVQSLTLNNIIRILSSDILIDDTFSSGISYNIIDNRDTYSISNIYLDVLDITNKTIIVEFNQDINFKHGDWIKIEIPSTLTIPEFNENLQIIDRLNNKSIKISFINPITISIIDYSLIYATDKISIYPFKLKINHADEISINTNINSIIADSDVCRIFPNNNSKLINNINIDDETLIPNLYIDDVIARNLKQDNLNNELNYEEILKLPKILRFSSDYEPALNKIEIFNNSNILQYSKNNAISLFTYNSTTKKLSINISTNASLEIGDLIYIDTITKVEIETLQYRFYDITNITKNGITDTIELGHIFDETPITGTYDITDLENFNIYLYKTKLKNTELDFNLKYFGIQKNLLIAKSFDTINPMPTNNNLNNTSNKYPLIDEHGVTNIDRNIFKSSWDKEFYYKTIKNKYN